MMTLLVEWITSTAAASSICPVSCSRCMMRWCTQVAQPSFITFTCGCG
ncbi:MAG: hypothetical protein WDN49_15745 [Acetobacteraceae bacterium]